MITVLGGGTGGRAVLAGLRDLPVEVVGIINMSDDGGSSGILREQLGVLPPGDIRQAIAALSMASPEQVRQFEHRYTSEEDPELAGHPEGNLLIARDAAERGFLPALQDVSRVMQVKGRVLPITTDIHNLCAKVDGRRIVGEHVIGKTMMVDLPELWLEPTPLLDVDAGIAIREANLVVIAPGDLYGSLAPTLLVDGVSKALAQRRGPLAYVANIVNRPTQTLGFNSADYTHELERFAGGSCIDVVLQNTGQVSSEWMERHAQAGEELVGVVDDIHGKELVSMDMINRDQAVDLTSSVIPKSFVRHDGDKVAAALLELLDV